MSNHTVTTEHAEGTRVATFTTYDEAVAYGQSFTPLTDGSLYPNLPDHLVRMEDDSYVRSLFSGSNRYAVIHTEG